ncbi:MAG: hypothetical protein QM657_02715 [Lacrimispora sp.]|uniref:hypothetical protein n=1 Tax=Lacrimispora sp. TaxID=2719234 RepID=UPI0039E6836F
MAAVFSLYTVIVPMFFGYSDLRNRYISLIPMVWMHILYDYLKKHKAIRGPWLLMIFFSVITMINTCQALIASPYISRMIKSGGEFSDSILKQGIGDYSFIYMLVLMTIIFFWEGMESSGKWRICYLSLAVLGEATIVLSNYMMALILSVLGIGVLLCFKIIRNNTLMLLLVILLFMVLLLFWRPLFSLILEKVLIFIPDGKTFDRLQQMHLSLYGKGISIFDEFVLGRIPVLSISTNSIIKYPFFGLIYGRLSKSLGYYVEFGQHSFILDTMALYGVGIGIMLVFLLSYPFFIEGRMKGKKREISIVFFAAMIFILGFNNATYSLAIVLYVIYPYICDKVVKEAQLC